LDQVDEGKMGLVAAAAKGVNVSEEVILDTGGGSLQLTKGPTVYGTETASATFGSHVEKFMGKPLNAMKWTKDVFSRLVEEAKAKTLASNTAGTGDILSLLKESIAKKSGGVKGIGNVYNGMLQFIKHLAPETSQLTLADLEYAMGKLEGLTTDEVGQLVEQAGLDKRFAGNVAANLPLVTGIMKAFDLKFIDVVNADSGMGVFLYGPLWKDGITNSTVGVAKTVLNSVLRVPHLKQQKSAVE
jgi:exopolyphosphatase/pppGpp-phosphohydrolase